MGDTTNARKNEVIGIIRDDPETDRRRRAFDAVQLIHRALPELKLEDVDPSVEFLGRRLSFPLLISSMTGGDHDRLRRVNRTLAAAAERERVAMGVGSQRVMFTDPASRDSFDLRPLAPSVPLLANLGAVQLNYGFGLDQAREAVHVLNADGMYLHLNPLQEAVQPEGNTDFSGLAEKIGSLASAMECPVLVKEVGAGLSLADARLLVGAGIRYLDVAGSGGTSWSRIEHHRQAGGGEHRLGLLFQDWGIPTPEALRALVPLRKHGVTLVASGGIRHGVDMLKAMVLGASLCGLARPFLDPALDSVDAVCGVISTLRREFITGMFLLGAGSVQELIGQAALVRNRLDTGGGA